MIKSNKSYMKRLKITKNGKILSRKAGQNHFNAKDSSSASHRKGRSMPVHMSNKSRSRFLVNM